MSRLKKHRAGTRDDGPPIRLVMYLIGFRIALLRYWCSERHLASILSARTDLMLIIELAIGRLPASIGRELRNHCSAELDLADIKERPVAVVDQLSTSTERVTALLDRGLWNQTGWEWYCLGRALGDYRVAIRRAHHVCRNSSYPDFGQVARAMLNVPTNESASMPSFSQVRNFAGAWQDFVVEDGHTITSGSGIRAEEASEDAVEGWIQRLTREIQSALSSQATAVAGGYLNIDFDDLRRIAYRNVGGKRKHVDFKRAPRLWILFKELVRQAGTPLDLPAIRSIREANGLASDVEDHTLYSEKYLLNKLILPLGVEVREKRPVGYVLEVRNTRK